MAAPNPNACPACEAPIPDGANFCPKCATPAPITSGAPTQVKPKGRGSPALVAGTVVDAKYEILERLGTGGFGNVYRVRHKTLGAEMALKTLHASLAPDENIRGRFFREARILVDLKHDNIVSTHDAGEWQDTLYMVMDYCPGETLQAVLKRRGRLPGREAAAILVPVLRALECAHARGIVHRDLKPANLIVRAGKGGAPEIKVLDFGIAKVLHEAGGADAEGPNLTSTGMTLGTLLYMSPEQAEGLKIDARADLYALGAMLFQMLTGRLPFEGESQAQVLKKLLVDPIPSFAQIGIKVEPPALEKVVGRAMQKEPGQRYASATQMLAELNKLAGSRAPEGGRPAPAAREPQAPTPQRSRLPLAAAGLVALAVVVGLAVWAKGGRRDVAANNGGGNAPSPQNAGTDGISDPRPANAHEPKPADPRDPAPANAHEPKPADPNDPPQAGRPTFTLDDCPDFPVKPGSFWRYRNGKNEMTSRVTRHEPFGGEMCAVVETSSTAWAGTLASHYAIRNDGVYLRATAGQTIEPPALVMKLPLAPGDAWTSSQLGYDGKPLQIAYAVEPAQMVTVPAGTYRAVVLALNYPQMPAGTPGGQYWYARGVGAVKDSLGNELVEYSIGEKR